MSHVVHDHTSILAMVERKWNLPALTHRDANATDLFDLVDLTKASFIDPPRLEPPSTPAGICTPGHPGPIPPS